MDNNKQNKTNSMAILGIIFSFLFSLLGLIFSIIALKQIKQTHEEGKGIATAGLVISIIKLFFTVFIIGASMIAIIFTEGVWGSLKENIIDTTKCSFATECQYDETSGNYNCVFKNSDGVEEYVICDEDSIPESEKSTFYSEHIDDEDYEDTFDYDREY